MNSPWWHRADKCVVHTDEDGEVCYPDQFRMFFR